MHGLCSAASARLHLTLLGCCIWTALLCPQGSALSLVQDLPISKPFTVSEINSVVAMCAAQALCPFYLDLKSVQPRLAAAVDRMKALSSVVHVALCKVGEATLSQQGTAQYHPNTTKHNSTAQLSTAQAGGLSNQAPDSSRAMPVWVHSTA